MIKSGVRLHGIRPELAVAYTIATAVFAKHGSRCVITSCIDGKHSRGSLHYAGCAVDLRSHEIPKDKRKTVLSELSEALGDDFDVLLEAAGTPNEHYHLELQPKQPYGA